MREPCPDHRSATRPALDDSDQTAIRLIATVPNTRVDCVLIGASKVHMPLELGAGEGIRTLDPNLGKVVLYP